MNPFDTKSVSGYPTEDIMLFSFYQWFNILLDQSSFSKFVLDNLTFYIIII